MRIRVFASLKLDYIHCNVLFDIFVFEKSGNKREGREDEDLISSSLYSFLVLYFSFILFNTFFLLLLSYY